MKNKPLNLLLLVLIVGSLVSVSWLSGQRYGARQAMTLAASRLSSVEAQSMIDELQTTLEGERANVEAASARALASAARAQTLTDQLDEQMRQNLNDANDLALYRQIETSEKAKSVDVARLSRDSEHMSFLELTLVQWQGRDRITGELQISLQFDPLPDSALSAEAATVGDLAVLPNEILASESGSMPMILEPIAFDFRFFQNLTVPLPRQFNDELSGIGQATAPEAVIVRILPADTRIRGVERRFIWNEIAE